MILKKSDNSDIICIGERWKIVKRHMFNFIFCDFFLYILLNKNDSCWYTTDIKYILENLKSYYNYTVKFLILISKQNHTWDFK